MNLSAFINKHRDVDASLKNMVSNGVSELNTKLNETERQPPEHIPEQKTLIHDLFDTDETVWMFFFDGGRYDFFDQLYAEYFEGELQRCYNGGYGYTGDWTVNHLVGDFGNRGLFSYVPLRGFGSAEYDGRKHFAVSPDIHGEMSVKERLAELGYRQRTTTEDIEVSPKGVNQSVREHRGDLNGGVVRYLAPHPPFDGLEDLTSESTKTMKTEAALENGELTYQELTDAYIETYRKAFRHAVELIPYLDGRVVITADHGTCLTCGQLYHGRYHDKHDHLTVVPWFEVSHVK